MVFSYLMTFPLIQILIVLIYVSIYLIIYLFSIVPLYNLSIIYYDSWDHVTEIIIKNVLKGDRAYNYPILPPTD